jgi:hypothetical protein
VAWDIKGYFHDEEKEVATVTWRFTCLYQEKEYIFDGASVVKFREVVLDSLLFFIRKK